MKNVFSEWNDEIMNLLKGLETFLSQNDRLESNVSINVDIARQGNSSNHFSKTIMIFLDTN